MYDRPFAYFGSETVKQISILFEFLSVIIPHED
jgi:hypothetical protein